MAAGKNLKSLWGHLGKAVRGEYAEYTTGSVRKAIFYLAIPMMLEMVMESLFAVVDIFFVGRIGIEAVAAVGLTESVLSIIYSVSMGLSMAATAIVARRVGEKKPKKAADAAFQAILLASILSVGVGALGYFYAQDLLRLMGGAADVVEGGFRYTEIIFGGNISVMLLFLINGIFRGAGNAAIAMRSLWLANGLNILLDPVLIFGFGPISGMGIEGAAWATFLGRSVGVVYQLYYLVNDRAVVRITRQNVVFRLKTIGNILRVSFGGMGQFLVESASWIFLTRVVAESGSVSLAAFTISMRILLFTLLPAFGLSNAAATLVGQNLGADQPERAETSVWDSARYNAIFLGLVSIAFIVAGDFFIGLFNDNPEVIREGALALLIICLGYVFFAYGMVVSQSFNGAGDTYTPTLINIALFWVLQIPMAYFLAIHQNLGATGVFVSISVCHSLHALVSIWIFRKGKWKTVKV
ncbi:MATE family efflux transporter [soil metagenome]